MNIYEQQGRERKAAAIADKLVSALVTIDDATERLSYDEFWHRHARAAGYNRKTPPSMECRRMVVEMLRGK